MGLRLRYMSVRCDGTFTAQNVPETDSTEEMKRYVRNRFQGLSCYWRVWIDDQDGKPIICGTRSGRNATGERWIWKAVD